MVVPISILNVNINNTNNNTNTNANKGRVQKPPARKLSVEGGGGYPPFPLTFFRWVFGNRPSVEGGRGVPPLSVKKKSIKNWPKNGVFGQKTPFSAKKFRFRKRTVRGGGGGTPLFPLTFRKILVRGDLNFVEI